MNIDDLCLAVAREAGATAHGLALKSIRQKTIPLCKIAEEVTGAAEARIDHLFATSQLGPVACAAGCALLLCTASARHPAGISASCGACAGLAR